MIYEIANADLYVASQHGAVLVCISADGTRALISAPSAPAGIAVTNGFDESTGDNMQLARLLSDAAWRQPCKDC